MEGETDESVNQLNEEIKLALLKLPNSRSYDDLLLLKSYITKTEFITKNLAGVVNPKQMNDICRNMSLESYQTGEAVFNQGDIGDKVYVLLSGSCEVRVKYKIDLTQGQSEIREKLIVTYHRGQFFGERALQFDEPRAGTVLCTSFTDLVTITKHSYLTVLNDARREEASEKTKEQLGTKESVITILSKIRERRNNQELDAVAAYLWRRIPFFQKFTTEQLVELCRVAETVSIWGRSILFKQGQMGQAFYVILTGTVEVWVQGDMNAANSAPKTTKAANDLTEGLGHKVNQLVSGDVFGERALENDTSQRMASIITCEDKTELLVIAKEDYHNLVYVMMHSDSMARLSLLRRTEIFRSVDVVHLKVLARFMEPRKYGRDEPLYVAGRKAIEMIIVEKGECRAETVIREGYEKMTEEEKRLFHEHHYMMQTNNNGAHKSATDSNGTHAHRHFDMHDHHPPSKTHGTPHSQGHHSHSHDKNYHPHLDVRKNSHSKHHSGQHHDQAPVSFPKIVISHASKNQPKHSDEPVEGLAFKPPLKRFNTMDLIPMGELKTVNLGRIAPNSVLATYITQCETIHNEVFHPETVIASSLVTAYTIGKHDFFNHMPKDTRAALVKIVAEFKTPMLSSLWENVPRVLDENQWKQGKTWDIFRQNVVDDKKDANILQTFNNLSKMHISASSGNNSQSKIAKKNEMLMHNKELHGVQGGHKTEVSLDWGLPKVEVDTSVDSIQAILAPNHSFNRVPFGGNTVSTPVRPMTTIDNAPQLVFDINNNLVGNTVGSDRSSPEPLSLINSAVSKMIRNRINYRHFSDKQQQLLHVENKQNISRTNPFNFDVSRPGSPMMTLSASERSLNTTASKVASNTAVSSMPFFLIQLHREHGSRNPGPIDSTAKGVRCYMRLCGAASSCATVKDLADVQMENVYLTLFKSEPSKEKELLLRWVPFKGFDSVPLDDSDHFLIYCRSTPIEYASISPSKSLFNAPFPALCKQKEQRYSCIVANVLADNHSNHVVIQEPSSKPRRSRHHGSHQEEEDEEEDEEVSRYKSHLQRRKSRKDGSVASSEMSSPFLTSQSVGNPNVSSSVGPENAKLGMVSQHSVASSHTMGSDLNTLATSSLASKPTNKPPGIPYLQEFSVLHEVLVTSSNRLDCIRYAIQRFGSFEPADMAESSVSFGSPPRLTHSHSASGIGQRIYLKRPGTAVPQTNTLSQQELSGGAVAAADRVLELVNNDNKRICVVPLFKWLLVVEDTLRALDFTNAFSDDVNATKHSLESEDFLGSVSLTSHEEEYARQSQLNGRNKLLHSFKEAGLLSGGGDPVTGHKTGEGSPEGGDGDPGIKEQSIAKSLQILERDLQTKELSKKILQQSQSTMELGDSRRRKTTPSVSLNDSGSFARSGGATSGSPVQRISNSSSMDNLAFTNNTQVAVSSIRLEARLKNLNASSAARSQFIAQSDKLFDAEHGATAKKNAAKKQLALGPSGELKQELGQVSERIDLAIAMRSLNFTKVPLSEPAAPQSRAVLNKQKTSAALPTYNNGSSATGGQSQSTTTEKGSVGKRIAENIRLLSESLSTTL